MRMSEERESTLECNGISYDSNNSGTYSFSYPGHQMKKEPSTLTKSGSRFRKPVRVLPFMHEALKYNSKDCEIEEADIEIQNAVTTKSTVTINSLSLDDSIHLEPMPEDTESFSQGAENPIGYIQAKDKDVNVFQGMGWLMESGRKDQTILKTQEQQLGNINENPLLLSTQPSGTPHQYFNYSTTQNKQSSHFGIFKEIGNSSDLKSKPGTIRNHKTPLKSNTPHIESYNEIVTPSHYSTTKPTNTLCYSVKSQFTSVNNSAANIKNFRTPSKHPGGYESNAKHQINMALQTKAVFQEIPNSEIPSRVQNTTGYGCPVKFCLNTGPINHIINNQNKENVGPVESFKAETKKPLNLNIKDLTGHSEHLDDLKAPIKPNLLHKQPAQLTTPHTQPPKLIAKMLQLPSESFPQPSPQTIFNSKPPLKTPPSADSAQINEPPKHPSQLPKSNASPDNVMFSLPLAKSKNSSLTVNGKTYAIISQLGTGGSSKVYQVMDSVSNTSYAVKCVDLAGVDRSIARGYLNEIELLKKLQNCESVIRLFGYEYVKKTQSLLVVMEKGDTDFSNFLRDINKTKKISSLMIAYYWTEMVTAVDNIHKNGIIHSDLKPPNFLLVSGRLKLIDFGIASSMNVDSTSVVKDQMMGTFNYMSPEAIGVLNNGSGEDPQNKARKITFKSDVWSLGCILYNLVYGRTPFAHVAGIGKLMEIYNPQHTINYPKVDYPEVLVLTIKSCLTYDPKKRPTTMELLQSPLVPKLEDPFLMAKIKSIVTPEMWLAINEKG